MTSAIRKKKFYLRPNVQGTPLFNQWPVFSLLLPPTTAAMHIAYKHVRILESIVVASQRRGTRVIKNLRIDDVIELLERTLKEQAHMLKLAEAIKTLNQTLIHQAKGYSMDRMYENVPNLLKGYVELVYDLNNYPSVRYLEGLLYQSPYYQPDRQSLQLSLVDTDDRPMLYYTPRFEDERAVTVNIPFQDKGIDELFKMRFTARRFDEIKQVLRLEDQFNERFLTLLSEDPPRKISEYRTDGIRIRYFNHATLMIETNGISILTDPLIAYEYESATFRYSYADLPEIINYVLITHGHPDHVVIEALLQLRYKIQTLIVPRSGGSLADPSLKLMLENIGFTNVVEIDEMESIPILQGSIVGLPFLGEHGDLNIRGRMSYLVRLMDKSILCVADSRIIEPKLYEHLHKLVGDVDVLFISMECDGAPLSWMYGPLCTTPLPPEQDNSRRMNASDCQIAMDMVRRFRCKQVYVYGMGMEPWLKYISCSNLTDESIPIIESNKLVKACTDMGIVAERLYGPMVK